MSEKKICLSEISFYLMLLSFMGCKAVGLSETQWPFWVAIIMGSIFSIIKLLLTSFNYWEWILNASLLIMGLTVYLRNSHLEVLMAILLIIGMKDVPISRAMKVSLLIWGPLFCLTVIRALFGIEPGYIGTQMKVGIDFGVIRYSLGFTHPNVLHITFFIVILLLLYVVNLRGSKLFIFSLGLLLLNCYVFIYSLSYTGFAVVTLGILANIVFTYRNKLSKVSLLIIILFSLACFVMPIVGQYILPHSVSDFINRMINQRFMWAGEAFSMVSPHILGSKEPLPVPSLDSSYSYMLFYHGILPLLLFVLGYLCTLVISYRKKRYKNLIILLSMVISGITEQYMGNMSFKNISLLLVGEALYDDVIPAFLYNIGAKCGSRSLIVNRYFSLNRIESIFIRIKNCFVDTKWNRCIWPAIVLALLGNIVFGFVYHEPTEVYKVVTDNIMESSPIIYNAETDDWVNSKDILILGKLEDGCILTQLSWVDTKTETFRGRISTSLWCFLGGYVMAVFFFRKKRSRGAVKKL